ncbi:hypothetical protein [Protaetiibacter larvae]|uniref:Uncharacterized protein n=1 Tax=Protaetiibacter larvae TaxID=2592654 RepID=A0A5C1YAU3_9MICO|nr:hypothetical protein [Protaetiibacter larvae]QEO10012.1 hypothetical protein FLP23_08345 [Protaetiibacter larvae]
MALSKKRRPVVLITGRVIAREPKQRYVADKPTGEVERYDVTLFQTAHATPDVRFPLASGLRIPEEGEQVVLIADCGESDEWGANFRAVRYATPDDIDSAAALLVREPVAAK